MAQKMSRITSPAVVRLHLLDRANHDWLGTVLMQMLQMRSTHLGTGLEGGSVFRSLNLT